MYPLSPVVCTGWRADARASLIVLPNTASPSKSCKPHPASPIDWRSSTNACCPPPASDHCQRWCAAQFASLMQIMADVLATDRAAGKGDHSALGWQCGVGDIGGKSRDATNPGAWQCVSTDPGTSPTASKSDAHPARAISTLAGWNELKTPSPTFTIFSRFLNDLQIFCCRDKIL